MMLHDECYCGGIACSVATCWLQCYSAPDLDSKVQSENSHSFISRLPSALRRSFIPRPDLGGGERGFPQVVQTFRTQVCSLRPENALRSSSGLANNWAMGFASCREVNPGVNGTEAGLFDRCLESMRREAERCSWLNSVVMQHSLAGGTGSGLGSGLLQVRAGIFQSSGAQRERY